MGLTENLFLKNLLLPLAKLTPGREGTFEKSSFCIGFAYAKLTPGRQGAKDAKGGARIANSKKSFPNRRKSFAKGKNEIFNSSLRVLRGLSSSVFLRGFLLLFFLLSFSKLYPQSAVPLATEISRLERVIASASTRERYDAFMALARLRQLSGNHEAALKACEGALALYPRDGDALLERVRLLISLGEHEKAASSAAELLRPEQEKEIFLEGRYLGALAEAFQSGNIQALVVLAGDADFTGYRSAIYYTIWRLTDTVSYRTRLTSEFPLSPEAAIAGGKVVPASTPLWLLFPGRESITLTPTNTPPIVQTPAPQSQYPQTQATQPPVPQTQVSQPSVLQTGIFSRVENAQTQADNLKKAGFTPEIFLRQVNGVDYWAVGVPYGNDMNSMIGRLRDAGFESFPINR